jgi:TIR domain-containing protein
MPMLSYAFLSYQTADKVAAGKVKALLSKVKIEAFLAHEDIEISIEWRLKILEEIGKANIFICLLSKSYLESSWCVQESGIASFREQMAILPLSLDGTTPVGFTSNFQSVKVDPNNVTIQDLLPAFFKYDFDHGVAVATDLIADSQNFRSAEENFKLILPHISNMSTPQIKALLERAANNDQVHHASLCARDYIPPLLKSHGKYLAPRTRSFLKRICERYQ